MCVCVCVCVIFSEQSDSCSMLTLLACPQVTSLARFLSHKNEAPLLMKNGFLIQQVLDRNMFCPGKALNKLWNFTTDLNAFQHHHSIMT